MFDPHPAIGLTAAIALARAAFVDGSLVRSLSGPDRLRSRGGEVSIRIGTPAGVITCEVQLDSAGDVARLGVRRVARRIAAADIDLPHADTALQLVG